jgi:hypothetical protein
VTRRPPSTAAGRRRLLVALLVSSTRLASGQDHVHHGSDTAWLGPYSMAREASGTSWQPEAAGMEGLHFESGRWRGMVHGFAFGIYTDQGGPRGGTQAFSTNMAMVAAGRSLAGGTFAVRGMASLEPLMGRRGYRHLLQTGESADGVNHLIDRQHPHDLAMELAAMFSHTAGPRRSVFVYAGWPGVVSAGLTWGPAKLDASAFNGREPDGARWGFEAPRLDSGSVRLTWNPTPGLSAQVSAGWLSAPERLHPDIDLRRYTASVGWTGGPAAARVHATAAWGRNVRTAELPNCFLSSGGVTHRRDRSRTRPRAHRTRSCWRRRSRMALATSSSRASSASRRTVSSRPPTRSIRGCSRSAPPSSGISTSCRSADRWAFASAARWVSRTCPNSSSPPSAGTPSRIGSSPRPGCADAWTPGVATCL